MFRRDFIRTSRNRTLKTFQAICLILLASLPFPRMVAYVKKGIGNFLTQKIVEMDF